MKVTVNHVSVDLNDGVTLQDALDVKNIKPAGIATAVNGKVIPAIMRNTHKLSDGDEIVIIKAFYGG